jgi:methanogenic corrinoid protein MtbC1
VQNPKPLKQEEGIGCGDWAWTSEPEATRGSSRALSQRQTVVLEKIIENSIVPRLLLASRSKNHPLVESHGTSKPITTEQISEFAELVIRQDVKAAFTYFEELRTRGVAVERLFQELLVPVAKRLGELWDEDINDFMDVTRGASHLQMIIKEYSSAFQQEAQRALSDRRVLLTTMPGEMHTIGISIIGEHFRRAGWHVWGGPSRTIEDILELVEAEWFDVVGLSMSRMTAPEDIASDIGKIRRASKNKGIIVQVGGAPFSQTPDLAASVGADCTAASGEHAVKQVADIKSVDVPRL